MSRYAKIMILIAVISIFMLVLVACGSGASQPAQSPAVTQAEQAPAATSASGGGAPAVTSASSGGASAQDGASLLQDRCTACHGIDRVTQTKKDAGQWEQTVSRMIGHGAQLSDAEKATLVAYLAKTYGP